MNELEKDVQIILVWNKIDLPNKEFTKEEGTKLAYKYNSNYLEASALLGKDINEIFYSLTSSIYQGIKIVKKKYANVMKKIMEIKIKIWRNDGLWKKLKKKIVRKWKTWY